MGINTQKEIEAYFFERWMSVKHLKEALAELDDEDIVRPNTVGNLLILYKNHEDIVGYIDFSTESFVPLELAAHKDIEQEIERDDLESTDEIIYVALLNKDDVEIQYRNYERCPIHTGKRYWWKSPYDVDKEEYKGEVKFANNTRKNTYVYKIGLCKTDKVGRSDIFHIVELRFPMLMHVGSSIEIQLSFGRRHIDAIVEKYLK